MILRLLTFLGLKTGQKMTCGDAWKESGESVNRAFDIFYTCILIAIVVTSIALMSCAQQG